MRFGVFGGKLNIRTYAPLTALPPRWPLPHLPRPRQGPAHRRLLAGRRRHAAGRRRLSPNGALCQFVQMRPGDTESFDVLSPNGKTTTFELEVLRYIKK